MDAKEIVSSFEQRADKIGMSIDTLCEHAGIDRSTWQRWKSGAASPTLRKLTRVETTLTVAEEGLA